MDHLWHVGIVSLLWHINMPNVFPIFYAGNIQYFSELVNQKKICFEVYDFFEKQTFRNRCIISTANGVQQLNIPVIREGKTPFKSVRISYAENWQMDHWRALTSAYKNSPYFEFYEDYFKPFYFEQNFEYLWEFNLNLFQLICSKLDINVSFNLSEHYVEVSEAQSDFRSFFPKKTYSEHINKTYFQVFDDKHGFLNNLSILDLLFNLGPESKFYL